MSILTDNLIRIGSRLSGSAGDIVASHNAHGPYFRTRTVPTDPMTTLQLQMRSFMATITEWWTLFTPPLRRLEWERYAANVPLSNRFGRFHLISGFNHFVRANITRLQASRPVHLSAPTTFTLGRVPKLSNVTAHRTSTTLTFNFDDTLPWTQQRGSYLALYASVSRSPTINFYNGPFRFIGTCPAGALEFPVSPFRIDLFEQPTVGWFTHVRVFLAQDDGRVSTDRQYRARTLNL